MSPAGKICLENVKQNNLKGIDLQIAHRQWLAICGLSGSGKSSLAFETLYAEGQRRYVEALSVKTRQFVRQLDRADADQLSGIPPAVAIRAQRGTPAATLTLGLASEIEQRMRLLFAQIAQAVCHGCGETVRRFDAQSASQWLADFDEGIRVVLAWPLDGDAEEIDTALRDAMLAGFVRAIHGDQFVPLEDLRQAVSSGLKLSDELLVVADRLQTGDAEVTRMNESFEAAFQYGAGRCIVLAQCESEGAKTEASQTEASQAQSIDGRWFTRSTLHQDLVCGSCNIACPDPEPQLFSVFSDGSGCRTCKGTGKPKDSFEACHACAGTRFEPLPLSYRVAGKDFAAVARMTVDEAIDFVGSLDLSKSLQSALGRVVKQIQDRLAYLQKVGLGYLSLDRSMRTLSTGESQRVLLTSALGTTLVNLLFVLDEPSLGLHRHDVGKLIGAIGELHQRGNTVVVVDHDETVIRAAERVVEMGPGAGAAGGEVVFEGTVEELVADDDSLTGQYLARKRGVSAGEESRKDSHRFMKLIGAAGNNLRNINVEFPLGVLCAVTGVSGAGKSTLVQDTLYPAVANRLGQKAVPGLPFEKIHGADWVSEVVSVDSSPIGRSSRSNPVTYVKAFADIRNVFAETADGQRLGMGPGKFSFNVPGGRCEKCRGDGQLSLDMQFMSDLWVSCDQCDGSRFREDVLSVRYRDRNIAQVLGMTVRDAFLFFRGSPSLQAKLKSLIDVGLEYIQLGQPANTLSSGESQRLKLASWLNTKNKRVLFVMDQPTAGLHMADVIRLLDCFNSLISVGHSMVVVEHNLHFIKHADWLIDLGPQAGVNGGSVVATGTPEEVASCEESLTGRYLREYLK